MTHLVFVSDLASNSVSKSTSESGMPGRFRGGAIAIGNFDGVHRGHAILLSRLRQMADRLGGPAIAVTFDPHPAKLLRPESAPTRLTSIAVRAERMSELGIDALVVCETTPELLNLSASDFFQKLVSDQLEAKGLVEGPNFFFGKDRTGDIEMLRQLADRSNCELEIVEAQLSGEQMVSSSMIRRCITAGDVAKAALLFGHCHQITGIVTEGAGRGRQIGFPTANLSQIDALVPKPGVYAGLASIVNTFDRSGERKPDVYTQIAAAIHIGPNPTFNDETAVKVEVHLIDYDAKIYGQTMRVDFADYVRDVQRFESPEHLKIQLAKDVQCVRDLNLLKGQRR